MTSAPPEYAYLGNGARFSIKEGINLLSMEMWEGRMLRTFPLKLFVNYSLKIFQIGFAVNILAAVTKMKQI